MDPLDLTGAWFGRFAYPPGSRQPPVRFWAAIIETGGDFEGTTSEPNTMGRSSDLLGAVLRGRREGRLVAFTKAYDGASDAAHSVDYAGDLDAQGETIVGEWRLAGTVGTFEMRRTHAPGAAEEAARDEAVQVRAYSARAAGCAEGLRMLRPRDKPAWLAAGAAGAGQAGVAGTGAAGAGQTGVAGKRGCGRGANRRGRRRVRRARGAGAAQVRAPRRRLGRRSVRAAQVRA